MEFYALFSFLLFCQYLSVLISMHLKIKLKHTLTHTIWLADKFNNSNPNPTVHMQSSKPIVKHNVSFTHVCSSSFKSTIRSQLLLCAHCACMRDKIYTPPQPSLEIEHTCICKQRMPCKFFPLKSNNNNNVHYNTSNTPLFFISIKHKQ